MKKEQLIIILAILLISLTIWQVGAQKPVLYPPPPPLEHIHRNLAPPGATNTPRPDEDARHHQVAPSVTPIPYKAIIDKAGNHISIVDKAEIIVLKANGDYFKYLLTAEQVDQLSKDGFQTELGLAQGDKILDIAPPARMMMRYPPLLPTPTLPVKEKSPQ